MKSLIAVVIGAFASAVLTQTPSVAGKWNVSANVGGTASESVCTFTQKDDGSLSGTCEGEQGPKEITGKVDGKTVTWQLNATWEGQTLTVIYRGTLQEAAKITGSVDVQPLGVSGDFTAILQK